MTARQLHLSVLPEAFAIVRLAPSAEIPAWATTGSFFSVTRTAEELSVIVEQSRVPRGVPSQKDWRAIQVHGPFALNEVGVLASLASTLAAAGISVLALATFDTDYVLVAATRLHEAISTLENAGHVFSNGSV